MVGRLRASLPSELLDNFQIIPTRLNEELDETKVRIAYIHDLADDPQLNYLGKEGWKKFHLLVFVSNWQMQTFIARYNIPWSRCVVIQNAIEPFAPEALEKPQEPIRLIYTPTPHRGLEIVYPVFLELLKTYPDLQLDVFSSFRLYGWEERDAQYKNLFDACEAHPNINYHGSQPNEVVREALTKAHIFAYPSIWSETSCLCLIEAMSAGCLAVHSNLGALYETAANLTYMYQFNEDRNKHAALFLNILKIAVDDIQNNRVGPRLANQKLYVDEVHNWSRRKDQWQALLTSLLDVPRGYDKPEFVYRTI